MNLTIRAEGTDDVVAVTQLVLTERRCRDRGRWEEMRACFADASTVEMSWFSGSGKDFVRRSSEMAGSGDHAVHRLGPPFVRVLGHRALAELPLTVEFRVQFDGIEADLASYARLQYRAVRSPQGWRIAAMVSIYERDTLAPARPGAQVQVAAAELDAFRSPYRCLAWYLTKRGYGIGEDLLGEDRPDQVRGHYEADDAWLAKG